MRIALIAHDKMKAELVQFCIKHEEILSRHELIATGTTGTVIMAATKLKIKRYKSGPLGGDMEIGAKVAKGEVDLIIFFRDPLTAQPHEPDISALFRLSDVYKIPLASNINTAELFFQTLK